MLVHTELLLPIRRIGICDVHQYGRKHVYSEDWSDAANNGGIMMQQYTGDLAFGNPFAKAGTCYNTTTGRSLKVLLTRTAGWTISFQQVTRHHSSLGCSTGLNAFW
jgi:hypothetical protein